MIGKNVVKIDVQKVLEEKAPNTKVPSFLVKYLRRIVHEDEFNRFFKDHPTQKNLDFIAEAFKFLNVKINLEGEENLPPKESRYIFAGNHPMGGLDGVAIGYIIGKKYEGKVRFFSNDLLMNLHPMKDLFIPVNKVGSQSKNNADMMRKFYESDNHLVTFPAGMCSRKVKGKVVDLDWKKNFISKAIEYERDIVPIYFEGRNSNFFYNLANLRKFLKIKLNIEMLYLADEMFKQRGKSFTVRIGKPIPWQTFDSTKTQIQWAQWVKKKVYDMA